MTATVPRPAVAETSAVGRGVFIGLAVVRFVLAIIAVPLAPALYRDHVAILVFLRPTKEVFLFAGFQLSEGHTSLPAVVACALPLLLGGVWVFFGLGRAYAESLKEAELPGIVGRLLPKKRLDAMCEVLDERGPRVVFLGRLAAFPSTLMAAAAGTSGLEWRRFLVADAAGALVSLAVLLSLGLALQETYESAGTWVTAGGVVVLATMVVLLGRSLTSSSSTSKSKSKSKSS